MNEYQMSKEEGEEEGEALIFIQQTRRCSECHVRQASKRVCPYINITSFNTPPHPQQLMLESEPPTHSVSTVLLRHVRLKGERPLRYFSVTEGETKISGYFLVTHFL